MAIPDMNISLFFKDLSVNCDKPLITFLLLKASQGKTITLLPLLWDDICNGMTKRNIQNVQTSNVFLVVSHDPKQF
jgi:hypothetical protein